MEPLKQRLEDVEAVIRQLEETIAGLERARELFLREPGLSGAMRAKAAEFNGITERLREALQTKSAEREDILSDINRQGSQS